MRTGKARARVIALAHDRHPSSRSPDLDRAHHAASLACGDQQGAARRYPADIAPFADVADFSPESFAALHALLGADQPAVLFTPEPIVPSGPLEIVMAATGEQMIGTPSAFAGTPPDIVALGEADAAEMRALVELTRPGPFGPRTHKLGRFFGIRVDGRLAAMTGERMTPGEYTEMTAVCVHPDFRGRRYAQALLAHVSRQIVARGETPFLHVFSGQRIGDRTSTSAKAWTSAAVSM